MCQTRSFHNTGCCTCLSKSCAVGAVGADPKGRRHDLLSLFKLAKKRWSPLQMLVFHVPWPPKNSGSTTDIVTNLFTFTSIKVKEKCIRDCRLVLPQQAGPFNIDLINISQAKVKAVTSAHCPQCKLVTALIGNSHWNLRRTKFV